MAHSLREKQKRMARELILQATADEIVEQGVVKLSLQAVADRAGVSIRTLYNYFDSRDTLVGELQRWSDEQLEAQGGYLFPEDLAHLDDCTRTNFLAWSAQGNIVKALVQLDALFAAEGGSADPDGDDAQRAGAIARDVMELSPRLSHEQASALAQVMRMVISGRTWHRLTVENGVDPELAADSAAWAYRTLRQALIDGASPFDDAPGGGES